jgi:hypothetical protein
VLILATELRDRLTSPVIFNVTDLRSFFQAASLWHPEAKVMRSVVRALS